MRVKTEVRAAKDGSRAIEGFAARFNRPSVDGDARGFVECLKPGCFSRAMTGKPDILCLVDHDERRLLGRTSSGTLRVKQTDKGLAFRCELANTVEGRSMFEMVKRGDYREMSFSMDVDQDDWTDEEDEEGNPYILRSIASIKRVYDVSPVLMGAYGPDVNCAVRKADDDALDDEPEGDKLLDDDQEDLDEWEEEK
jgi:HK97 family phage prohead protease